MRLVFRDGAVRVYDVKTLFDELPQLRALEEDPALFHSARLDETSAKIDLCMVTASVDYTPPFNVNDSFADALDAYMQKAGA